mmetsp:Transcript_2028/g.3813  ORF Transcript_2028/g.3813 Transcript_2028/m.3813 type:complete len:329 (-) Transcript_2028:48-1034(-)
MDPSEHGHPVIKSLRLEDLTLGVTLGTGTFGRVRLAKDKDGNVYALKILSKAEIIRLKQVEHIKSEKNILSKIHHPFIVNLYSVFQDERTVYMCLDYVAGGELFSHLRRAGRFGNDTARFFAASIVLAFEYLHSMHIAYRDLKPENLLLDKEGYLKITDFGFAKIVEDRTWTLCGTPEYLAPEIIQSKGHGLGVDWWALGILIYEMLAGYPPFYDENPFGIYQKILAGKIDFPGHFDSHAKDLIKKLLVADKSKRLGSLKSGADDIKKHKWFKGFDFKALFEKKLRAPLQIDVRSADDTSNFDDYPDSVDDPGSKMLPPQAREIFKDF